MLLSEKAGLYLQVILFEKSLFDKKQGLKKGLMEIWVVSAILTAALYLFVSEMISIDLTAIGIMVALMVGTILNPVEAVAGFANPAVITVGSMFLISKGLLKTGTVGYIGQRILKLSKGKANIAILVTLVTVAISSAFVNNTPVVVLFIPVVMSMCCEFGLSPSKFLIPLSYASILGGTCTLIGTSTNIIVSDLSVHSGYGAIGMFELSILGVPIALIGIVFLLLGAPKIMPDLINPSCEIRDSENRRYLAELYIPSGSKLIGTDPGKIFAESYPNLEVLELIRYSHLFHPKRDKLKISADDLLTVKGTANEIVEMLRHEDVELPASEKGLSFSEGKNEHMVFELIIPPQSSLIGKRLIESELRRHPDIHMIAVKRSGLHFTEKQIHDVKIKIGDLILAWCEFDKLERLRESSDFIIVEDVHDEIIYSRDAWKATVIFSGMVVSATLGVADIMVCALTAAFLMIVTGCLQMRDAYRALQGNVLMMIAGTIALGTAMQKTGASSLYAEAFLGLFSGFSPEFILGAVILLTSISTQILSNNATAVLLLPIAISAAIGLGVDPKPFIIGVCFGASACFASPLGYQTNLLVYGPGGYRFSDYLKMGIPLNLIVLVFGTIFIPIIWPL